MIDTARIKLQTLLQIVVWNCGVFYIEILRLLLITKSM